MISKEFIGRLGNQMFQYAAMRAVQELNNDKETICISFDKYVEARGFKNELNNFNIHKIKQVRKIKMTCLQFILIFLVKLIEKGLSVCIKNQYEYKRYLFEKFPRYISFTRRTIKRLSKTSNLSSAIIPSL